MKFLGPHVWKIKFPASQGKLQSPININSNGTICVPAETIPLLGFSPEYYKVAKDMKIYNDGHTGRAKHISCFILILNTFFGSLDLCDLG